MRIMLITTTVTTILTRIPEWVWVILLYGIQEWVFVVRKKKNHRHSKKMGGQLLRISSLPSNMGTWTRRLWEERIVVAATRRRVIPQSQSKQSQPPSSVSPPGGSHEKTTPLPNNTTSQQQVLFRSTSLPVPLLPSGSGTTGTPLTRIAEQPSFSHGEEEEDMEYDDDLASWQSQYSNHHPTTTTTTTTPPTTVKKSLFSSSPDDSETTRTTIKKKDTSPPPPPPPKEDEEDEEEDQEEREIRQLLQVLKVHEQDLVDAKVQHALTLEAMQKEHDTQLQVLQETYHQHLQHVQESTRVATTTTLLALVVCSQSAQQNQALDLAHHWKERYAKLHASYKILQERLDHRRQRQTQNPQENHTQLSPQQRRTMSFHNNNHSISSNNTTELRILMDRVEELEADLSQQQERWQRRETNWNHQRHVFKQELVKHQGQLKDMEEAKQHTQKEYQQVLSENLALKAQVTSQRRVRLLSLWGMGLLLLVLGLLGMLLYAMNNIRPGLLWPQGGGGSSSSSMEE